MMPSSVAARGNSTMTIKMMRLGYALRSILTVAAVRVLVSLPAACAGGLSQTVARSRVAGGYRWTFDE